MDNNDKKVIVGKKQILRLLKENHIKSIRIATDAQDEYVRSIREEALRHNVKVVAEGSMEEIARCYGIDVPSGAVGFLKD
ncbi:MAG TPA: ribosomal L7Ae/L30e/S12e/Gadd45 family protein [Candidatus Fimimonas merdipullorum]|uniref:Ribosomal L7Ae/L30e/S12e/Gadd45 family protein n=1 Tax=Candidatus Fimimonas merdipullorum TaxID=2840822 RepID=A0A9D1MXC7_9BACT|nr:ribosomal L7Ae/L30e/S12e/Gadd45 family protein [Candidatus Fimimonas merdipullorum]